MYLRIVQQEWEPFVRSLCARQDVESAGLILAEPMPGGEALVARRCVLVPEDGYLIRRYDRLRIDPVVFNRLVRTAREREWSVFTVHTHPCTDRPWFSSADDAGDARLIPSLFAQMAGPHGSLVVAGESRIPAGRAWTAPEERGEPLGVRIVGATLDVVPTWTAPESPFGAEVSSPAAWFARQRLALGRAGQATLAGLHVGIVGLGGTGSVVSAQLAHLGVGRLTLVDGDRVEASNVSRIIGARRFDAGIAWKVDVAAGYVTALGFDTDVRVERRHLESETLFGALAGCDIVFSCVDAHTPRALLNRFAYTHAAPVIDLGSAFRVDAQGIVAAGAGRVVVIGPGRPCLACWGHIDPVRLRLESLAPEERARLAAEGYVQGADVPQPSVIAFNTAVAGAAVVEFLRMVTAFAGADAAPLRLSFDFMTGSVRRNVLAASPACRICGAAASSPASTPHATSPTGDAVGASAAVDRTNDLRAAATGAALAPDEDPLAPASDDIDGSTLT